MELIPTILRVLQIAFVVIVTALIGNVIDVAFAGNPASINFAMFVCALCWVTVLAGILAVFVTFIPAIAMLVLDALATFFTLIAGIVLAARLGVHSCGNHSYLISNSLTNGSGNMKSRCHELQASTFFFWALFPLFAATLATSFLGSRSGGLRKGGPSMSQV